MIRLPALAKAGVREGSSRAALNPPAASDRLVRAAKASFLLPIANATDANKRDV